METAQEKKPNNNTFHAYIAVEILKALQGEFEKLDAVYTIDGLNLYISDKKYDKKYRITIEEHKYGHGN